MSAKPKPVTDGEGGSAPLYPHKPPVEPTAAYTLAEAAVILCMYGKDAEKRVAQIADELLPKTRVGPNLGRVTVRGIDLLRYLNNNREINGRPAPLTDTDFRLEAVP
jgi:hypothetical protein